MKDIQKAAGKKLIKDYIRELKFCLAHLDVNKINQVVHILLKAYSDGKTVFILGNGGSASTASHMACDLGKGTLQRVYDRKEKRFRVISLTDNVAVMTAYGNDLSYADIFVQQLQNLVVEEDVVIAISGSGNSTNVIKAVRYAKKNGAITIGFLGFKTGGKLAQLVDIAIIADSKRYGPCEDIHSILNHLITTCLAQMKKTHDMRLLHSVT